MADISDKCVVRCEYGRTICAGPHSYCQRRRAELLHPELIGKEDGHGRDALPAGGRP